MTLQTALLKRLKEADGPVAPVIRDYLSSNEAELRERHLAVRSGTQTCKAYTAVIDGLLKALFTYKSEKLRCFETAALIAIGGYGRGELNIRSDIDLMLLYKKRITPELEELTQKMLYVLWDTGLDLGFSIRSVDECLALAKDDLKTMTALLDTRHLHGDRPLFDDLVSGIRKKLFTKARTETFINDKIDESAARHAKYGGSVYILEPNVKEGEGGLRDIHTAIWAIKARTHAHVEPFSLGLISEKDKKTLEDSLDFILWVRNELHYGANRKTDQLSFDHQERIAQVLGFENTERALAVESFMQKYYRSAAAVSRYSGLILSRSLDREAKNGFSWPKKRVRIDKLFSVTGGALTVNSKEAFEADISAPIRVFEYAQSFDVGISQGARDLVLGFLERPPEGFNGSREVSEAFIKILKGRNVFKALSEMHRLGFLDRFIPEFADISCRVQHDMYHVYTVDAHTLFAVREIERLKGEYKSDFSLLSTLFEEIPNPEVLYLAVLLHDIGKAHGKGHAEKGAALVPEICRRLNLPEDDANLVRFLVKHHLLLADTAQYRDLHDEQLIIEFARKVGDIERLNLLYLLTFADVRAVGPEVWNHWKGALFQELYFKALTVLERGTFEAEEAESKAARIKAHVVELLRTDGVTEDADGFFGLLTNRYILSNSPDRIAEHFKTVKELSGGSYVMAVRQDSFREYTELTICSHDVHGLFSMITGVMAANSINILGAQINTLKNGVVLDILQVNNPWGEYVIDEAKLKKIEKDLADVITGKVKVASLVGKKKPSILDRKAKPKVKTYVQTDNEVSDAYTVIDIHTQNRVGLLYDITSALSRLGLYIYIAKISTKGDEAADIFYVKDIFGQKVYYKERLKELTETLHKILSDGGDTAGGQARTP